MTIVTPPPELRPLTEWLTSKLARGFQIVPDGIQKYMVQASWFLKILAQAILAQPFWLKPFWFRPAILAQAIVAQPFCAQAMLAQAILAHLVSKVDLDCVFLNRVCF